MYINMLDSEQVRDTAICLPGNGTVYAAKHLPCVDSNPFIVFCLYFVRILLHSDRKKQLGQSNSRKD